MTEVMTQTPETSAVEKPTEPQVRFAAASPAPESQKEAAGHIEPILGFIAPQSWIGKEFTKIGNEFQGYRDTAIHALHAGIVNHASNAVGVTQLVGEMLMFKANGTQFYHGTTVKNGVEKTDYFGGKFQNWLKGKHSSLAYTGETSSLTAKGIRYLNPVLEPAYNILSTSFNDSFGKVAEGAAQEKLPLHKRIGRAFSNITDIESATKNDLAYFTRVASSEDRVKFPNGKLFNRWQSRATLTGMVAMSIAATMPEDKDKPEEVERLSKLAATSPLSYIGNRVMTALNPLEWWSNKRAFIGLGMTICGMFTTMAGFRNVSKTGANKDIFHYYVNKPHAINGVITATAGSQLLLGVDSEQGWSRFGSTLWARMIFLPKSITNRYKNSDSAPNYYTAGQGAFQTANITAFMIGGAQKLPDGTVIDQKAIREEARKKAREEKARIKTEKEAGHHHGTGLQQKSSTPEVAAALPEALVEQPSVSAQPESAPAITSAIPEVTTVATPGSVIAANEAHHTAPEKSQEIAA